MPWLCTQALGVVQKNTIGLGTIIFQEQLVLITVQQWVASEWGLPSDSLNDANPSYAK